MEYKEQKNEYENALNLYINIVDTLLYKDTMSQSDLCIWTKDNTCVNFTTMDFKALLKQHGRGLNYRYYMRVFRTFGWIICKTEKFTNVQWINGMSKRVISVDYERYKLIKELLFDNAYFEILDSFIKIIDKLIYLDQKTNKKLCIWTKEDKVVNIKIENFKLLLQKEFNDYQQSLNYLRKLGWIICQTGNYTNIQWIDGKPMRVFSVDYEKFKLVRTLSESG